MGKDHRVQRAGLDEFFHLRVPAPDLQQGDLAGKEQDLFFLLCPGDHAGGGLDPDELDILVVMLKVGPGSRSKDIIYLPANFFHGIFVTPFESSTIEKYGMGF